MRSIDKNNGEDNDEALLNPYAAPNSNLGVPDKEPWELFDYVNLGTFFISGGASIYGIMNNDSLAITVASTVLALSLYGLIFHIVIVREKISKTL